MIKLIIADDEPLVQAGIKSMINWEDYQISIVGTASNGAAAYELIQEHSPELIITDIKMPVMSGLELARKCQEEGRKLPLFIILTSYEEFNFVREAITYQVVDYLIKLELTPEVLLETVKKAIERIPEEQPAQTDGHPPDNVYLIREQFHRSAQGNQRPCEDEVDRTAYQVECRALVHYRLIGVEPFVEPAAHSRGRDSVEEVDDVERKPHEPACDS